MLKDYTVVDFINKTGSDSPTPGGGSVAALTASSAAALIEMVASLTIDKKGYEDVNEKMIDIKNKAAQYKTKFLDYIDEDAASFNSIMFGFRMPKETDEEKQKRSKYLQNAFEIAATVPYNIGEDAYQLFDLARDVVKYGNKNAVTDGFVAAINARAAIKSAFYNVKINLESIKNTEFTSKLKEDMKNIESKIDELEREITSITEF
ncbi:MAG: cyclodeaminase/cyclohydrolase family protein [Tissierellia bacterium]|nr:cyclodeaminase/cyclohydrolase family protein [Tissierellia bacterium]